jgi:hypothetical protein
MAAEVADGVAKIEDATKWLIDSFKEDPKQAATGSVHYLRLMGNVCGGWLLTKSAVVAQAKLDAGEGDPTFLKAKINTARFFTEQVMPVSGALANMFTKGYAAVLECEDDYL